MKDKNTNEELGDDKDLIEIMALVDNYARFVNPDLSGWKDKEVAINSTVESREFARNLLIKKLRKYILPNAK